MREFGGLASSFLTNYDATFWLTLYSALEPASRQASPERRPCTAVPFNRVKVQPVSLRGRATMAALNLALVEAKLHDDQADGDGRASGLALKTMRSKFDKARAHLLEVGYPLENLSHLGRRQREAEASPSTLGRLWQPTADVMADAFGFIAVLTQRAEHEPRLRALGASLGRYIYLWDAVSDLEEDARKQRFNAILALFGPHWSRELVASFLARELDAVEAQAARLPLGDRQPLVDQLVKSLRERLTEALPESRQVAHARLRPALAERGFVSTQCDCDCSGCGECNCCETDCCGSECEVNPCGCGCGDDDGGGIDVCCVCCDCDDCCCCKGGKGGKKLFKRRKQAKAQPVYVPQMPAQPHPAPWRAPIAPAPAPRAGAVCPACRSTMRLLNVSGVEIDECKTCGGIWLDDTEIDQLSRLPSVPPELLQTYPTNPHAPMFPEGQRICPRCEVTLQVVPFGRVRVDACPRCRGTYLDHGELKAVLSAAHEPRVCRHCQRPNPPGAALCSGCGAPL